MATKYSPASQHARQRVALRAVAPASAVVLRQTPSAPFDGSIPLERERLAGLIDERHVKLFAVHAPAGFGKTTLLRQWQRRLSEQGAHQVWLSLNASHDDAVVLSAQLDDALREVPGLELIDSLGVAGPRLLSDRLVLFIDEIGVLRSQAALAVVRSLLGETSSLLQVVVAGRSIPHFGQARLRVAGGVVDVNSQDLRFRPAETATYFSHWLDRDLTRSQLGNVQACTEGWPAALQLARLSMRHPHANCLSAQFERDVAAYLDEVVIDDLSDEVRSFLIATSVSRQLTGPLCDALTGRGDGEDLLKTLEAQGLFLERIASNGGLVWYRLHPLFAGILKQNLRSAPADRSSALHDVACTWYLAEGMIPEAAEHARLAGREEQALELLDGIAMEYVWHGRVRTVLGWGTSLTVEQGLRFERLFVAYLWAEGFVGDREKALRRLEEVTRAARGRENLSAFLTDTFVSMPIMIAAMSVDIGKMRRDGPEALRSLSSRSTFEYGTLATALAYSYLATGELDLAYQALADGRQPAHAPFQTYNLAYTAWTEGHLQLCDLDSKQALAALGYHYERVEVALGDYSQSSAITASLYADALYETGDLAAARAVLDRHLPMIAETIPDCMVTGYATVAAIQIREGDFQSAQETLLEGEMHGFRRSSELVIRSMKWRSAWLAALSGAPRTAYRLRDELALAEAKLDSGLMSIADTLTRDLYRIRLDIHAGRLDGLVEEIARLSDEAARFGNGRRQLRLDILKASALKAIGSDAAVGGMVKALRLGVSHGFVQCYLDEGHDVLDLVRDARPLLTGVAPCNALSRLDMALGLREVTLEPVTPRARPRASDLEDLTAREADIVKVMEKGLTNREIAECLNMSENTVKWHLQHIFQKLGVGNRTEAVFMFRSGDV